MKNRREFLLEAGITLSRMAAYPDLFGQISTIHNQAPAAAAARPVIRGLMVDAGRVPELMEYYRRVIEFCADWQLNTLQFRLADDQGSALRFTSVPDLLTHKDAFTPEQLMGLADYAKAHGVDLIPELESFGHTGYITRSSAYAHLLDSSNQGRSTLKHCNYLASYIVKSPEFFRRSIFTAAATKSIGEVQRYPAKRLRPRPALKYGQSI
jgi:hypothetical protein